MQNNMREDWIEIPFNEATLNFDGKRKPLSSAFRVNFKGEYPYYGACEIIDYVKEYLFEGDYLLIGEDGANLLSKSKPLAFIATGKFWVNNHAHVVQPKNGLLLNFLAYQFNSLHINEFVTGTAQPKLNQNNLNKIPVVIPPLPIQRAIVSKIEALFSDLDNGIANFKKAQEQLKIYRQAVLKKAFEGGYSLNYDSNDEQENYDLIDENKKNHSNQKINSNHSSDNLPKGWKWVNSGEFFSFVTSGSRGWAKYYSESGSIFIRITNLNFDTLSLDLRDEKIQYVTPPQNSEGLRTKVEEGDFLFSITGYLGMFAIAPKLESAFVNQHVSLCRPKDFFDKKYLAYWIIAKSGGHYHLNKNQKGAVKAGLNLDDLKTFPVPLPPTIQEQAQIVQEIERRLSVCDKMEQSISESIEKAEALRQSILKKAFEGNLLSQAEIELCKTAADYEPASELLKKIQAEKVKTAGRSSQPKTKSKK